MPRPPSATRAQTIRRAQDLIESGLSCAAATRILYDEGHYNGARDYPSSGWIRGMLRDAKRWRESRTRELLREKVTRGGEPVERIDRQTAQSGGESAEQEHEGSAGSPPPEQEHEGSAGSPPPEQEHEGSAGSPPPDAEERAGFEEDGDGAKVWSTSRQITSLEQLLEACAVDLSIWQVDHYIVNTWPSAAKVGDDIIVTTLYQVKAWLTRRQTAPVEDALKDLLAQLEAKAPKRPAPRTQYKAGRYLLVPNLYDLHLNKRSYDGTYTIERAAAEFCAVADAVVARVRALNMPVERILFPAGNDALHADNLQGTTTKGTQLELAGSQRDAIKALVGAYEYAVLRLRELAPVDVVAVESNHDRYSVSWLGVTLDALFRRTAGVTVDAASYPRKYYRFGVTLIGLEHGDGTKPRDLAPLMAQEAPQEWAQSRYRLWLRGHVHHSAGMYYPITSDGGVTTRVIPALCPPDEYHVLHGFVGSHRAAEVMFFDRERGPAGEFSVFVDEVAPQGAGA